MYASRITVCSWEGAYRHDVIVEKPDLPAIETAIRRLDADRTTEVCIDSDDDTYLILGGGAGRYVGFVARSDEEIHNLVNPSGSREHQVELCVGGQTGYYTERQCVDLDTALRAASTFAERGWLDESITWELHR